MNRERIEAVLREPPGTLSADIEALIREAVDEALEAAASAVEERTDYTNMINPRTAARIIRSHKESS